MIKTFGRTKIDISYGSFRILRTGCKNVPGNGGEYALIQIAKCEPSLYMGKYGTMGNQWVYLYAFHHALFLRYRNFYG